MDGKELYNLYEAYMEVVENQQLDEEKKPIKKRKPIYRSGFKPIKYWTTDSRIRRKILKPDQEITAKRKPQVSFDREKYAQIKKAREDGIRDDREKYAQIKKAREDGIRDSYDYYDIILSHLLDEGYAETLEAAEVMMVNMSEQWRYSIIG